MYPAITLTAFGPASPGPSDPDGLRDLRREYAAKARRLEETLLALDNLISPQDWLDAGFGPAGQRLARPADRAQDRSAAPLSYLNEDEWRQHVALARDLCTRNHLALGFRDHVSNFLGPVKVAFVRRGAAPGAADGQGAGDPLLEACARAWDDWCDLAEWGRGEEDREEECRRRLLVEGECTLRFFPGDDATGGLPHVRHVEPELVRTPPGHSLLSRYGWGVVTREGDDEREEGVWLARPDDLASGRVVPSAEYVRIKANVDRTVRRGLSDFFPVGEHLRKVLGLLDNMAHVARLQAAIAWWEQYPTATMDQVATQVRLGADYSRPRLPPTAAGATTDVTSYEAGTVVRTEGGREVQPGPVSNGSGWFEAVEKIVLRAVGFRWGCPSYFSGDGDASFASVLVTGSPFVRVTESRQERLKAFACKVAARVLEYAERAGRVPAGACRAVKPVGTARPVVIADEEKKARTFLSLFDKNCADPVEFITSTGADPKAVAANIRAWKAQFDEPPPPEGPPPEQGPPAGPTPPGSAGGDGSSPNPTGSGDLLGEGAEYVTEGLYALLSEADRSHLVKKKVTDKNGRERTVWVRPDTAAGGDAHAGAQGTADEHPVLRAVRDPANLTADDVRAVADRVGELSKEELRRLNLALRQKIGGNKAALADRLLAKLRGAGAGAAGDGTGGPELAAAVDRVLRRDNSTAASIVGAELSMRGTDPDAIRAAVAAARRNELGLTMGAEDAALLDRLDAMLAGRPDPGAPAAPPPPPPAPLPVPPPPSAARRPAAPAAPLTAPPTPPNARLINWSGNPMADLPDGTKARATNILGQLPEMSVLFAAGNAIDGAGCIITADQDEVTINSGFGAEYSASRTIKRDANGDLYCHNDYFKVNKDGPGPDAKPLNPDIPRGADMLANQVRALRQMGVKYLDTYAAGSRVEARRGGFVGYKVWPKLGYDGDIPAQTLRRLPPELKAQMNGSKSILDLYATKAGQDWWAEHGSGLNLKFDMTEGSRSMKALETYLNNRSER